MRNYKALSKQVYELGEVKLVPIREEDKYSIMKWRNDQIYHLRQENPLTKENQNNYFKTIISKLFEEEKPNQLLFSLIENDLCIGYGGLVHINWTEKNAELSFIMDTVLEKDSFDFYWGKYLELIEQIAFKELKLIKLHTYAFDLRPRLYKIFESFDFKLEARLRKHVKVSKKFIDVVIHGKLNSK